MFNVIEQTPSGENQHVRMLEQDGGKVVVADIWIKEGRIHNLNLAYPGSSDLNVGAGHIDDILAVIKAVDEIAKNSR